MRESGRLDQPVGAARDSSAGCGAATGPDGSGCAAATGPSPSGGVQDIARTILRDEVGAAFAGVLRDAVGAAVRDVVGSANVGVFHDAITCVVRDAVGVAAALDQGYRGARGARGGRGAFQVRGGAAAGRGAHAGTGAAAGGGGAAGGAVVPYRGGHHARGGASAGRGAHVGTGAAGGGAAAGATAGSEDWWQKEKFEREVKNFLHSAKEGIDDDRYKDLLLKDPKAVLMVSINAAVEKPGLQPLAMRGVVLGASSVKNFESIFVNVCRASSDKYMKLSANDDDVLTAHGKNFCSLLSRLISLPIIKSMMTRVTHMLVVKWRGVAADGGLYGAMYGEGVRLLVNLVI